MPILEFIHIHLDKHDGWIVDARLFKQWGHDFAWSAPSGIKVNDHGGGGALLVELGGGGEVIQGAMRPGQTLGRVQRRQQAKRAKR